MMNTLPQGPIEVPKGDILIPPVKRGYMEYSNKNQVNIIPKEDFQGLIQDTFQVVADNMMKCLGPLGSSTNILDGMLTSATKDGWAIFRKIIFHNRYKKMVYNLIQAPCHRLNNTVGDGTTTAIVLTNYIFQHYQARKGVINTTYRLPRTFINAWDEMVAKVVDKVRASATSLESIDSDTIYKLAYVTSNGNDAVSKDVAKVYAETNSPVIKIKPSPTNKSYIEAVVGFDFPANLLDTAYAKNEDLSVTEKGMAVLIFNHKIEADFCNKFIIPINEICKHLGKKLLVIAPFYDQLMANTTLKQYVNYEYQKDRQLNLILTQFPLGKLEPNQLIDLSVILKAHVIDQELAANLLQMFEASEKDQVEIVEKMMTVYQDGMDDAFMHYRTIGTAGEALLSVNNGSIFRVHNIEEDERYNEKLTEAKKTLEEVISNTDNERRPFAFKVAEAQQRVNQLEMKNYIYFVGADSGLQRGMLEDSIDDVIKCIRSAVKHGVVPGCQLTIVKAAKELIQEYKDDTSKDAKLRVAILSIIQDAVINLYQSVLHGPDGFGLIKTLENWEMFDYINQDSLQKVLGMANEKADQIIKESLSVNKVFDLETLEFNGNIITSAETDVEVLLAASELIKILISGNQCVFLDNDINESHNEEVEAYV